MTRAVHFALHLDPVHAFYYHPVGLAAAVAILYFLVTAVWRPAGRLFERWKAHTALLVSIVGGVMLVFGGLRAAAFAYGVPTAGSALSGFAVVLTDPRLDAAAERLWQMLVSLW